jgi:non-specific serine/threonine protein kinase
MNRVWPGMVVEENSLQAQISTIRRALGKDRDFIKTDARRGYRFVAGGQDATSSVSGAVFGS